MTPASKFKWSVRIGVVILLLSFFAAFYYATEIEPWWLETTHRHLKIPCVGNTATIRLAHLSDFHVSAASPLGLLEKAITVVQAEKPDIICLTGDFIHWKLNDPGSYAATLKRLSAIAPTFACLGNHDGGAWAASGAGYHDSSLVQELLRASGITVLVNQKTRIDVNGRGLVVAGLGDFWSDECEPLDLLSEQRGENGAPVILLSHNPDCKQLLRRYQWDVMLCGHTHGGQLCLPLLGAPFTPLRDKSFREGLKQWEGHWISVTRGVGNLHGARLNCRPEVNIIDLE